MSPKNRKIIWSLILNVGDYLTDKLPYHPNHPRGRNSYAHICMCIKKKFKLSYKDIPDEKFNEVLKYIEYLKKNSD